MSKKKYRTQYNTQTSDPLNKDVGIFDVKKNRISPALRLFNRTVITVKDKFGTKPPPPL